MNWDQLSFAFSAGVVAVINPCGFAMLPAYLGYFMGADTRAEEESAGASLSRALRTGLLVSAGFLVVFGVVGAGVSAGLTLIRDAVPWVTMVIGAALVVLGIALLAGMQLNVLLPKFQMGSTGRDARSLFLFGISYAIASLSCALPAFIVVVSTSTDSLGDGITSFIVFSIAMGMVLTSLAVSLAFARASLLNHLRTLMRYADRIAGVLLVLAGAYLIYYWVVEQFNLEGGGVITNVEGWSSWLTNTVADIGGIRIGLIMSMVVAAAVMRLLVVGQGRSGGEASVGDDEGRPVTDEGLATPSESVDDEAIVAAPSHSSTASATDSNPSPTSDA